MTAGFVEQIVRRLTESEDEPGHQRTNTGLTSEAVDWMGEIARINVDGTVEVRLAREMAPPPGWAGDKYVVVKSEELIVFEGDEEEDEEGDVQSIDMSGRGEFNEDDEEATDDEDEWEDASDEDEEEISHASLDGMSDVEPTEEEVGDVKGNLDEIPSEEILPVPAIVDVPETNTSQLDKEKCAGFDILETVPDDHPFKSDTPVRTSPEWLSRIRREHRILLTSLPGNSPPNNHIPRHPKSVLMSL